MKKQLLALAIAGAFIAPTQADTIGFEVGVSYWDAGIGGSDDSFDYADNYDDGSNTRIYALLEHPIPIIPNVLVAINSIENDNKNNDTSLDTSFNDYLLYYEVLDNVVELDLGIGARQFSGEVSISGTSYDLDPTMPVAYAKAQFNLPITGLSLGVNVLTGSTGDDKSTDATAFVRWESGIGLGLEGGYRTLSNELEVKLPGDDPVLTPDLDGAFASVFFHF
jgi:outer membrane protein